MKHPLLSAALLITLSGCTSLLFPYEKPATPAPEAWREAPQATEAVAAWPDAQWWKQFDAPELSSLIDTALQNNNDIGAAVARVRQANAQVTINGAPLLPALDASFDGTHTHTGSGSGSGNNINGTNVGGGSNNGTRYNAGFNASYELDFWGKNYSALQSAQATRDASIYDAQVVRLTVTSSVATIYFDLLATDARLALAKENLANANSLLDALRKRYDQGLLSGLDVAQQESVVASQNAVIPGLSLQRSKDLDALAVLVGSLPETLPAPTTTIDAITVPSVPEGLSSGLLERRPDVQFAEANLMAAHADINRARAAFFPDISLTGQFGYASAALNSLFQPGGLLVSFGGSLVQPIFEGGALTGQLELTKAQYDELAQNYQKAVLSAFSDTEDSLAAVRETAAQEAAQGAAVKAAATAYELSQRQFNGGIVDITSVLNTQRTLYSARDALAQARLAHLQAIAGLYKSFGGGWKMVDAH